MTKKERQKAKAKAKAQKRKEQQVIYAMDMALARKLRKWFSEA